MTQKQKTPHSFAVVDIGSNSVRLVIYNAAALRPEVIRQKKARCGLAKGLRHDHLRLDASAIMRTLKVLAGFKKILVREKVKEVYAIATAAMRQVRHTPQGKSFHRRAEMSLGYKIKIVSGKREAALGAKGVCVSWPYATGVCGDLGGGSLELAQLKNGRVVHVTSLPLGNLTLAAEAGADPMEAAYILHQRLKRIKWLRRGEPVFYPIGGSWRAVARVLRKQKSPKSPFVHGHTVAAARAAPAIKIMAASNASAFKKMGRKIRRRAASLPMAAMVLSELIAVIQPWLITFSSYGVREGILSEYQKAG